LADAQHNLGWLLCEQAQYPKAHAQFEQALSQPHYRQQSKTLMTSGICHLRAGQVDAARESWQRSLITDPRNPVVRYQLALLDWQTQPAMANTLLAPLNAQQLGSAESLWLGVRVARALNHLLDMQQLGQQLLQRYPESVQAQAWIQRKFEEQ
jgi:type IV pilus assembly protein PilF